MSNARTLSAQEAADYLGIKLCAFHAWVRRGVIPGKIEGTNRYDRKAIDAALDRRAGLEQDDRSTTAYEEWNNANPLETHQIGKKS